jgi:hypothetical protein
MVDLALAHGGESAQELMLYFKEEESILKMLRAQCPEEVQRLERLVSSSPPTAELEVDASRVLKAFEAVLESAPALPAKLPRWSGQSPSRSMLTPLEGGVSSWTVESFRASWR